MFRAVSVLVFRSLAVALSILSLISREVENGWSPALSLTHTYTFLIWSSCLSFLELKNNSSTCHHFSRAHGSHDQTLNYLSAFPAGCLDVLPYTSCCLYSILEPLTLFTPVELRREGWVPEEDLKDYSSFSWKGAQSPVLRFVEKVEFQSSQACPRNPGWGVAGQGWALSWGSGHLHPWPVLVQAVLQGSALTWALGVCVQKRGQFRMPMLLLIVGVSGCTAALWGLHSREESWWAFLLRPGTVLSATGAESNSSLLINPSSKSCTSQKQPPFQALGVKSPPVTFQPKFSLGFTTVVALAVVFVQP